MRQRANALIIRDKKILLIRERGYWYTPGGGIEDGESPSQAIARECDEEIGVTVLAVRPYFVYDSINIISNTPQRNHCFFVDIEGEPRACTLVDEIEEIRWVDREGLSVLPDIIPYEQEMIFDRLADEGLV